jgi:hypothetical protein
VTRALVIACLACAALALAALNLAGALEVAAWCAAAWALRAGRRGARWLSAALAVGLGFAAWVRLVTQWVSAIAPRKPPLMEWQTSRLGALLLGCAVVLILSGIEAWRGRRRGRPS